MLNNISWASYWYAIVISSVLYYGYVLLVYYRNVIVQRFQSTQTESPKRSNRKTELTKQDHYINDDDSLLPVVQSLSNEITAYLEEAASNGTIKAELIFSLQQIVGKYADLQSSPYTNSISKLIKFECRDKCAIYLDDEEVRQVWNS